MARGAEGRRRSPASPPTASGSRCRRWCATLTRAGLSVNAGFWLVTNAALFGFLLLLWLHLRDLGFALPLRLTGLLIVGFTQGAVRWFEYQYWMSDPAALFLVMLAFFLLERRRWAALAAASVAAALVRETYVLVYPYVFLHQLRAGRPWPRAALRTVVLAALPFAVLVAIRRSIVPNQPDDFVTGRSRQHGLPLRPPSRQPALRGDDRGFRGPRPPPAAVPGPPPRARAPALRPCALRRSRSTPRSSSPTTTSARSPTRCRRSSRRPSARCGSSSRRPGSRRCRCWSRSSPCRSSSGPASASWRPA